MILCSPLYLLCNVSYIFLYICLCSSSACVYTCTLFYMFFFTPSSSFHTHTHEFRNTGFTRVVNLHFRAFLFQRKITPISLHFEVHLKSALLRSFSYCCHCPEYFPVELPLLASQHFRLRACALTFTSKETVFTNNALSTSFLVEHVFFLLTVVFVWVRACAYVCTYPWCRGLWKTQKRAWKGQFEIAIQLCQTSVK